MQIPDKWSRARKMIAHSYYRNVVTLRPHENIVRVIGAELGYKRDQNNNYPFVRLVIKDLKKLERAI